MPLSPSRLLTLALVLLTSSASAQNVPRTESLFVSLLAGNARFDDRTALDKGNEAAFGLGFRFSDRFSGELAATRTETTLAGTGGTPADVDTIRVEALWHYFRAGRWQPYVAAGIGQQEISANQREDRGSFAGGSLGLVRPLYGPLNFRFEFRGAWCPDDDTIRLNALAGITVAFGGDYRGPGGPPEPDSRTPGAIAH